MSERAPFAPPDGSIERGRVTRIEPYGAFVQLERYRGRGLVHISQIASYKVERVEDVVSIDDVVWVKVLEVRREFHEGTGRPLLRINLSMKSVTQDGSAQDLDQAAQEAGHARSRLERNLNSSIGMGVALDPMASSNSSTSKLVLKQGKSDATVINGYSLVDDTEGEPEQPVVEATVANPARVVRPMGRGRGTTLPAWMTTGDLGPTGAKNDSSHDSRSRRKKRKHKERKKHHKRKHSERHKKHKREDRKRRRRSRSRSSSIDEYSRSSSDEDNGRRRKHRRDDRRHRRRSRSRIMSNGDYSRSSRDDEKEFHSERKKRRGNDRKHGRRGRSRSVSEYSGSSRGEDGVQFTNIEDARKLIADLERKRRR